jgi:hypothetical protein
MVRLAYLQAKGCSQNKWLPETEPKGQLIISAMPHSNGITLK